MTTEPTDAGRADQPDADSDSGDGGEPAGGEPEPADDASGAEPDTDYEPL